MITIRHAELSDLKTLQQLGYELLKFEHDNWDPSLDLTWPYSAAGEAKYRQAILEKFTILAYDNKNPIGYLIGTVHTPPANSARSIITASLDNIFVRESARHSGVGHQLVDSFRQHCIALGVNNINVTVNSINKNAIAFYEHENFLSSRLTLSQKLTQP